MISDFLGAFSFFLSVSLSASLRLSLFFSSLSENMATLAGAEVEENGTERRSRRSREKVAGGQHIGWREHQHHKYAEQAVGSFCTTELSYSSR